MSVEKRIKEKAKNAEKHRDRLTLLNDKKKELLDALESIENMTKEVEEELYKIEDYFIEHYASIKVEQVEIVKGVNIDVLIAHQGTSTFAVFGGILCSAKTDPEDKYVPEIGEAIAIQRLKNKILNINYGAEF